MQQSEELVSGLESLRGQTLAVVASTGGHLEQAVRWADRLGISPDSMFVTFDSPQSRSILRERRHSFVPYIAPRDRRAALMAVPRLNAILASQDFHAIMTTGAGVALAVYLPGVVRRMPVHYIESVSRFDGPSLTGRVLARLPMTRTYTQHKGYPSERWEPAGSLLTDYVAVAPEPDAPRPRKFFVTLGTIRPFRFDALVEGVLAAAGPDDEIVWQLGETLRSDLPGELHVTVPSAQFDELALAADVVVTHAGVGSILRLLDLGISPIVVPRTRHRNEHVDDHQREVAVALSGLGLVTHVEVATLGGGVLHQPRARVERLAGGGD